MAKISVIVPVYKAEAYLQRCVESILGQTFSEFELILVDDGSPDDSISICRRFEGADARVRVLRQENRGQAAARNYGMTVARGQWICFVDSDDLIHPQMLEFLHTAAMESGAGVSMCEMLEGAEPPEDYFAPQVLRFETLTMDEPTLLAMHDADRYPAWVTCAKLIRRELIEAYPFTEGRVYEDNEVGCHWVCGGKVLAKMEHPLYFYRKNMESTTKSEFSLKKLDYLWALESIIRYFGSIGFLQMRRRFLDRYVEAATESCYGVRCMLGRPDAAKDVARRMNRFLREENVALTRQQRGKFLDAANPGLARLYWPVSAVVETLRQEGLGGLAKKLTGKKRGEDL